jgi:type I restriction enzyme M protein
MVRGGWRGDSMNTQGDRVGLIWAIAELLRHDYKPSEYGKVILPFTLLRRLDC